MGCNRKFAAQFRFYLRTTRGEVDILSLPNTDCSRPLAAGGDLDMAYQGGAITFDGKQWLNDNSLIAVSSRNILLAIYHI